MGIYSWAKSPSMIEVSQFNKRDLKTIESLLKEGGSEEEKDIETIYEPSLLRLRRCVTHSLVVVYKTDRSEI